LQKETIPKNWLANSEYGIARLNDPKLAELRFNLKRKPRRALAGKNVTQMHYARQGIITPEMEYRDPRKPASQRKSARFRPYGQALADLMGRQHPGQSFGAAIPAEITPEFVREKLHAAARLFRRTSIILKSNR
jgi:phosphomethylpyrimidine synthase